MRYFILFSSFFVISCGYADIDSVPSFKNLNISKNDSYELCKFTNQDNSQNLIKCAAAYIDSIPDFEDLNIIEDMEGIELCKLINEDRTDLLSCLTEFFKYQDNL
jgi:hypothetical protein